MIWRFGAKVMKALQLVKRSARLCFSCLRHSMSIYYVDKHPMYAWCSRCKSFVVISRMETTKAAEQGIIHKRMHSGSRQYKESSMQSIDRSCGLT
jgi:hypothetical protein